MSNPMQAAVDIENPANARDAPDSSGSAPAQEADLAAPAQSNGTEIEQTPPLDARTLAIVISTLVIVVFALHLGAAFFIPLLVSLFSSYALSPVVGRLERWRIPRALGAAITMLLVIGVLGIGIERTVSGATDVLEDLPRAVQKLRYAVTSWNHDSHGTLKQVRRTADELQKLAGAASVIEPAPATATAERARPAVAEPAPDTAKIFAMGTASMSIFLGQLVSVLFLTYFLLAAGNLFRLKLIQTLGPSLARRKKALQILHAVHEVSQRYFALVVVMNVAVGLATGLGLYLLDVDHALFWGAAMAVLHTIPYLGAAAVTGAVGLTAFTQFESLTMALAAAAIPLAAATVIGIYLQTALLGRAGGMNAVVVFVALLFWGMVWGAWGLLLAFPIMASVKIVFSQVERLKPVAVLMSN